MDYKIRCECKKDLKVTGADAGSQVRCACGRTVDVPPLHQLRALAGQAVLSPALRIQTLLLEKKLPGTRECVVCFETTDGLGQAEIECQRGISNPKLAASEEVANGCLAVLAGGWLGFLFGRSHPGEREIPPSSPSQDIAFTVPVPVCDGCRPQLLSPAALYVALRQVPEYAALLTEFPEARTLLVTTPQG